MTRAWYTSLQSENSVGIGRICRLILHTGSRKYPTERLPLKTTFPSTVQDGINHDVSPPRRVIATFATYAEAQGPWIICPIKSFLWSTSPLSPRVLFIPRLILLLFACVGC